MSQTITVRHGDATATLEPGVTALEALKAVDGISGQIVAARVAVGSQPPQPWDLDRPLPTGDEPGHVDAIPADSDEGRAILRHPVAHLMAQAVTDLFPGAKWAIGPPVEDGFYYDFDVERPFTPEDLESIEAEMRKIVAENQRFERAEIGRNEALELFADQPYKVEIIEGVAADAEGAEHDRAEGEVLSVYRNTADGNVPFVDLCRGPHLPGTGRIKAFKLLRSAGAYWRGDEKKPMLQRIYGTAWESKQSLDDYLHRLEEAQKRDHRKLGRELELYSWPDEVGAGIAVWHPKGAIVRQTLEDLSRAMHLERDYEPVFTPHIGKGVLWEESGHLDYYKENMFPAMAADEGDYYVKPMNCPFHILIYRSKTRSYRELPIRYSELGTVYRYERSGVVNGMLRARGFTQDDSHIFCTTDQLVEEIQGVMDFTVDFYEAFGLKDPVVHLSTVDPEAAIGTSDMWRQAEAALRAALDASPFDYDLAEGEGAFYGPKIDFDYRDALGRLHQLTTIQCDFATPERFGLEYVGEDNTPHRPVMVHRALYGSVERFLGVYLEHTAGALPPWLAPVQARLIPIRDDVVEGARTLAGRLMVEGLRVDVDDANETMQYKVRRGTLEKVPWMLVVGPKELEAGTVSVRTREGTDRRGVPLDEFIERLERSGRRQGKKKR